MDTFSLRYDEFQTQIQSVSQKTKLTQTFKQNLFVDRDCVGLTAGRVWQNRSEFELEFQFEFAPLAWKKKINLVVAQFICSIKLKSI